MRPRVPWQAKFAALALIWGSSFLLMKLGLRWFSPIQIATGRILLGAVTVVVLLHLVGGRLPRSWPVWRHLVVVAVFLASLPFVLFPLGEERVSSALAGIGNATTPIATVLATMAMLPSACPRASSSRSASASSGSSSSPSRGRRPVSQTCSASA